MPDYFEASGEDLAKELRGYFIPDFSNWPKQAYFDAAIAKLLKDLKAEEPNRP